MHEFRLCVNVSYLWFRSKEYQLKRNGHDHHRPKPGEIPTKIAGIRRLAEVIGDQSAGKNTGSI
jgi:hypothetical protein